MPRRDLSTLSWPPADVDPGPSGRGAILARIADAHDRKVGGGLSL